MKVDDGDADEDHDDESLRADVYGCIDADAGSRGGFPATTLQSYSNAGHNSDDNVATTTQRWQ